MCARCKAIKDYSFCPTGSHVNLYSKIPINLLLYNPVEWNFVDISLCFLCGKKANYILDNLIPGFFWLMPTKKKLFISRHWSFCSHQVRSGVVIIFWRQKNKLYFGWTYFQISWLICPHKSHCNFLPIWSGLVCVGNPGENGQIILWFSQPKPLALTILPFCSQES